MRRAALLENPWLSGAWETAPLQATAANEHMATTKTEMCAHEKITPDTEEYVRKQTKLCGTKEVLEELNLLCPGHESHRRIQGSVTIEDKNAQIAQWRAECSGSPRPS